MGRLCLIFLMWTVAAFFAGVAQTDGLDADLDDLTESIVPEGADDGVVEHRRLGFDFDYFYEDIGGGGPTKADVDDAAKEGLRRMHELYFVKEPQLFRLGLYLNPNEPAAKVAAFSEPNPRAVLQSRYGYAAVQASLRLKEKYPETRSRRNPEHATFVRAAPLLDECPLRGFPRCPPASRRYRTSDGTCNNPEHPWRGASMLPMQRFLMPSYEDGVQEVRRSVRGARLPSAREISVRIHRDRNAETPSVTMMFMQWGQFLDHDVTSTAQARAFNGSVPRCCARGGAGFLPPELTHPECLPIPVSDDDWFLGRFGVRCLEFIRSAPSSRIDCDLGWREQINQVTSYIDASTVYGSDPERADSLRLFRRGLLQYGRAKRRDLSPPDPPGGEICHMGALSTQCFRGGDSRVGEQPGLTAFHTVFLRYHNRLATILLDLNPHWSDEKIYQETRRIVAASIQHISYKEFLPILLGPEVMRLFDLDLVRKGYYDRYDSRINPAPANAFSSAAFRFGHSLVQNSYVRSDRNHRPIFNNVTLHEEQNNPENIWSFGSVDRLILGFSNQPSQRRDEFICHELTHHLFQNPGDPFGMDLAAVNIQRGRDHGIPSYTSWREPCGLTPIRNWDDLEPLMAFETIQRFRSLYEHVDDIDLYPGGLAEKPVRGGVVGPTFACIIAQQFSNFRKADRFWYENGDFESSFTPAQLQQLRRITYAQIVCEVLPEVETIQPFVFLSPDDFRNERISCDSLEMLNIDMRAWQERRSASIVQDTNKNHIKESKERESKRKTTLKPAVDGKLELLEEVDDKLDFNDNHKEAIKREELSSTTPRINDKIDFDKPVKISDKISFGNKRPVIATTTKRPDKLSFSNKRPTTKPPKVSDKLSLSNKRQTTTQKSSTIEDFDVIFLSGNRAKKIEKSEPDLDHVFDGAKIKRSILDYYDDDDLAEEIYEDDDDDLSRKRKRKKKPSRIRTTTRPIGNKKIRPDYPLSPLKIKVTNVSTSIMDIIDSDRIRHSTTRPGYFSRFTTPRPYEYNEDFVLHPTINNDKLGKKRGRPDLQVNINIQYMTTTPRNKIKVDKYSRPNVHIIENSYAAQDYYHSTKRPLTITPIRTTTRRPTPRPNYANYNQNSYRPTNKPSSYAYDEYNRPTKKPSYSSYDDYNRPTKPAYFSSSSLYDEYRPTKRPSYSSSGSYDDDDGDYYARPSYNHDRYENRPFSTSKRPYIYKPSQGYLSMFDELQTTTKRTIYMQGYVNKVSRPPNIPSYLYLDKYYKDGDEEGYRYKTDSSVHYVGDKDGYRTNIEDRDGTDQGEKSFVKISSVQGNRVLYSGNKEEIINTAQQKEGDLELGDGAEVFNFDTEDDEIEKLLVDVIPRESRNDDWLIYNELSDDKKLLDNPIPYPNGSDANAPELPKPFENFWKNHKSE